MEAEVTYTGVNATPKVVEFSNRPQDKNFSMVIVEGEKRTRVGVNIQTMLDTVSAANKTVIKQWYKNLTVLALNKYVENQDQLDTVESTDIVGEIFDDE